MMPGRSSTPPPPLTPDQIRRVSEASRRVRTLRRAAGVARFNGWMLGIFGVLSLATGMGDAGVLVLGVGLVLGAVNEIRGGRRLRHFDPSGARTLALNQAFVALVICGYCAWALWESLSRGSELTMRLQAAGVSDPSFERLARSISIMLYASAIGLTIVYQSAMGVYYATRGRHARTHLRTTEAWILDVQRAAA